MHIKRLVLVLRDEVHEILVHHVRQIAFTELLLLAVLRVGLHLAGPVFAAALKAQVLVKAPVAGFERDLAPLAHRGGGIACRFQHFRQHDLLAAHRLRVTICQHPGAKDITSGQTRRAGWPAHRIRVAVLEARPAFRQGIDVRRLKRTAIAADVPQPDIVGENEDDVRLGRIRSVCCDTHQCKREKVEQRLHMAA